MSQPYSKMFYDRTAAGSINSAGVVVPLVLSLFPARSVVDVGCGVGGWLETFAKHGISDYLGVDGDYVSRDQLKMPSDRFRAADLATLTDLGRLFDLACCLEVAEHLPATAARSFVALLAKAAPVVLFSAAIPGQGGTNHINEQWQSYWADLFASEGYVTIDCIRPQIYFDDRVEFWYRQNTLVFCRPEHCPAGFAPVTSRYELDRIHPGLVEVIALLPQSGWAATHALIRGLRMVGKAVLRRTGQG